MKPILLLVVFFGCSLGCIPLENYHWVPQKPLGNGYGHGLGYRNVQGDEPDLMSDIFDWMIKTDTEECHERMICDIASRDQADPSDLKTFLDDEAMFVSEEYEGFAAKLRGALEFGEDANNYEQCEEEYKCPFTAEDLSTMMQDQFADSTDDN